MMDVKNYIEHLYNQDGTVNINFVLSSAKILKIEQLPTNSRIFPDPKVVDFIAFSQYENDLLKSLFSNFISKKNYMTLLVGNPSSGKSIFSYQLGMNIKTHSQSDNSVYYIDIAKAPNDIDEHIALLNTKNVYFVIDNIHLNPELAYTIYTSFQNKEIKLLFVGRDIDRKFFELENIENIYAVFEYDNELHRLKSFGNAEDKGLVLEKIKAIINAFKKLNNISANLGDDKTIADKIGDNLILLYYFLDYWKDEKPRSLFAVLEKEKLLIRVWNKITHDIGNDEESHNRLISIAVLYQYEICAYNANSTEFARQGLTQSQDYDYGGPCSLYHANYARLVIDAYCRTPKFKRSGQSREDLTIKYLKEHFEANYQEISLADELVKLRNNYESILLEKLLNEIDKQKIEDYFVTPNNTTTIVDFAKVFNIFMSFGQKENAQKILLILISKNFEQYAVSLINLMDLLAFIYIQEGKEEVLDELNKFIMAQWENINIGGKHLAHIAGIFVLLSKYNKSFYTKIYKKLDIDSLVRIAKNTQSIDVLGSGLISLNAIDSTKTAEIYEKLDIDSLVRIAKSAQSIQVLGSGLISLNAIDSTKMAEIYEKLDIDSLVCIAKSAQSINVLGSGLISLNAIDSTKMAEIYKKLDIDSLVRIAKSTQSINVLGDGLNSLYYIDKIKTREIYKSLDIAHFVEEFKESPELDMFMFNFLSTIIVRRENQDEILELKKLYKSFKDKNFYCIGCNDLKNLAHMIKNLKEIEIDVMVDIGNKLFRFIANSNNNEKFRKKIPYFFASVYNLYGKDYVEKTINRYILQNYSIKDDVNSLVCDVYISISYQAFLSSSLEWIGFMKKAYKHATNEEKRAEVHYLFAKNYLAFNDGQYSEDDFKKAQHHYAKSLEAANDAQKIKFQHELGHIDSINTNKVLHPTSFIGG